MGVAGFTSTGSKHPDVLYGPGATGVPLRMVRSSGCVVRASDGRDYLDCIMALGAVALGYGHPAVTDAVIDAARHGAIGPLSPEAEPLLAADLAAIMPWIEEVRFLKTGAEAVAAAVRLARVATGRDHVIRCGYHGWLDWCSDSAGVPVQVRALHTTIPFNDVERTVTAIRHAGDTLAAVVVEPVIDGPPSLEWLVALRRETDRAGAILVFDEIKTAFRLAMGGATERWRVQPDLVVLGKALANGYPLAAVGGAGRVMRGVADTWISSTMATEWVSLAAARATLAVMTDQRVPEKLAATGQVLWDGLVAIAERHPGTVRGVAGLPQMGFLQYADVDVGGRVTVAAAARGLLFKRSAYNFVSLAHDAATIDRVLQLLEEAIAVVDAG